jgi:hypothetical protein
MFSPEELANLRALFLESCDATLVFKLKDGSTIAGDPVPCHLGAAIRMQTESEQGAHDC